MAHDVFISYAAEDKLIADSICSFLENNKIRCWIAPRDILPGQKYSEAIIDAVENAKIFVLVFSSNSDKSPHIISEVQKAFNKEVIIIPFRIEAIEPSKRLDYYIGPSHWLDALTPPLEDHIKNLEKTIKLLLSGKTIDEPTFTVRTEEAALRHSPTIEEDSQPLKSGYSTETPQSLYKPAMILSVSVLLIVGLIIGLTIIDWPGNGNGDHNPTPTYTPTYTEPYTPTYTPTYTRTYTPTPEQRLANPIALSYGFTPRRDGIDWENPTSETSYGCGSCVLSWVKLTNMQSGDEVLWKWIRSGPPYYDGTFTAKYYWDQDDGNTKIAWDDNPYCGKQGKYGDWTVIIQVNGVEVARGKYTQNC